MNTTINVSLAAIGGSVVGSGIVYFAIKTYLEEKIKGSIKYEYDRELEALKIMLNSQSYGIQEVQSERIKSVKEVWKHYIVIKDVLDPFVHYDDALTESEFESIYSKEWKGNSVLQDSLERLSLEDMEDVANAFKEIQKIRPFLSEKLWLQLAFLNLFSGRVYVTYLSAISNKKFRHWKNDNPTLMLVKENLTEQEYTYLKQINRGSIKTVQLFVEQKILQSISEILGGKIVVENSFENALKIKQLTSNDIN